MSKLINFPLACLIIVSLLAIAGLNPEYTFGNANINQPWNYNEAQIFYDAGGIPKCYANGTVIGEAGEVIAEKTHSTPALTGYAAWKNASSYWVPHPVLWEGWYYPTYTLYTDSGGANPLDYDEYSRIAEASEGGATAGISLGTLQGILIIIILLTSVIVVAGFRALGTGIGNFSLKAMYTLTAYIAVWGVFSVIGFPLISAIPYVGTIIYFVLTAMYCLGIIASASGGDNSGGEE
jgi:hypothetical protein